MFALNVCTPSSMHLPQAHIVITIVRSCSLPRLGHLISAISEYTHNWLFSFCAGRKEEWIRPDREDGEMITTIMTLIIHLIMYVCTCMPIGPFRSSLVCVQELIPNRFLENCRFQIIVTRISGRLIWEICGSDSISSPGVLWGPCYRSLYSVGDPAWLSASHILGKLGLEGLSGCGIFTLHLGNRPR